MMGNGSGSGSGSRSGNGNGSGIGSGVTCSEMFAAIGIGVSRTTAVQTETLITTSLTFSVNESAVSIELTDVGRCTYSG